MSEPENKPPGIGGLRRSALAARIRALTPDQAAHGARALSRFYGARTASHRPMPDFLIVGAKKGGTTSLANWLSDHPHVLPQFPRWQSAKSPHYFDINYWRGEAWYRSHFPSRYRRRARRARTGIAPLVGESSPYYLFHPAAPGRIAETVPDVKLVAVLRDPVSRAYSNYWDRVASGHEDLPTFEAALDAEPERLGDLSDDDLADSRAYNADHDHHTYLARGKYAQQLRRYFAHFDRDQMLVLSANDLFRQPESTFVRVESFLGLEPVDLDLPAVNVRKGNPPIRADTKQWLQDYYAPHNAELYELLGEDFGW